MKRHSGMFKPGQSGNPKGRPPKERALTDLLSKQGAKTILDVDGKKRSQNRVLARLLWELATTGIVTLPNGQEVVAEDFGDMMKVWMFIYRHIDGPPPAALDVTTLGQAIKGYTVLANPDMWTEDEDDSSA